uniref:C-type lectin domain-containing protein n=1 Tax=Anabas testudineus TaxID=64144 RepID=A0A7N6FI86_ANATE
KETVEPSGARGHGGQRQLHESAGVQRGTHTWREPARELVPAVCALPSPLCLCVSFPVQQCRECPAGWLHLDNQCYFFSSDKLDWLKSRASCEEMGGHLSILHSVEQHDAVEKEARRIGVFDHHYWIGLSDLDKEGDWRWVDNTTLQHKYWDQHSSEPDNHQSGGEHGEDCATLDSRSKTWFDVPCDHVHKRICQMAVVQLH